MMQANRQKAPYNKKARPSKEERKRVKEYRNNRKGKRDMLMALHE